MRVQQCYVLPGVASYVDVEINQGVLSNQQQQCYGQDPESSQNIMPEPKGPTQIRNHLTPEQWLHRGGSNPQPILLN